MMINILLSIIFMLTLFTIVLVLQSCLSSSPALYGMLSGSTITYDNSSAITTAATFVTNNFPTSFKIVPMLAFTITNYVDPSTSIKIDFYFQEASPRTQTSFIVKFTYSTDPSGSFPLRFRLRYLAWDYNVYTQLRHYSLDLQVNGLSSTTIEVAYYNPPMLGSPIIYSFFKGFQNSASDSVSNLILFQCVYQTSNSTHFTFTLDINARAFDVGAAKKVYISFLHIMGNTAFNYIMGSFYYPGGSNWCASDPLDIPNTHYVVGLYLIQRQSKSVRFNLENEDSCINTNYSYDLIAFTYFIIVLNKGGPVSHMNLIQTSNLQNTISFVFDSVDNPYNKSQANFELSDSHLIKKLYEPLPTDSMRLTIQYEIEFDFVEEVEITYFWNHGIYKEATYALELVRVPRISLDLESNSLEVSVVNVVGSASVNASNYTMPDTSSRNGFVANNDEILLNVTMANRSLSDQYLLSIIAEDLAYWITLQMIRVEQVEVMTVTNEVRVRIIGFDQSEFAASTDFSIDPSKSISYFDKSSQQVTLGFGLDQSIGNGISFTYTSPSTLHKFKVTSLYTRLIGLKSLLSTGSNEFTVELHNPLNKVMVLGEILCSLTSITILDVDTDLTNNTVVLRCSFNESIEGQSASFTYTYDDRSYKHIITIPIVSQNVPLLYWSPSDLSLYQTQIIMFETVQYLYLVVFLISLICMKMPGVETIQLLQFAFYSTIPIGIYRSTALKSFASMKYASGWNGLFSASSTPIISSNYAMLNLAPNFIANVNMMVIIALICPAIAGVLHLLGVRSKDYKLNPRLLKASKSFLLEFPLALLLFTSSNICVSFAINAQTGSSNVGSLVASIACLLSVLVLAALMTAFQKSFTEFNSEINEISTICNMSLDRSTKLRKLYPLFLTLELVLIALCLGVEKLFGFSLYIAPGVMVVMTVYVAISMPYQHQLDNLRLIANRAFLLILAFVQIYAKISSASGQMPQTFKGIYPWVVLTILLLGGIANGAYIVWRTFLWFKKPGIINMKMYVEQKGTVHKQKAVDYVPAPEASSFPKLEYGPGFVQRKRRVIGKLRVNKMQNTMQQIQDKEKGVLVEQIKKGANSRTEKLLQWQAQ